MIWLSALLVFGTFGVILLNLGSQDASLHPGFQQMIHARTPWLLLGLLWGGCALGIAAVARRRRLLPLSVVGVELALVAFVSWYIFGMSFLPPHELALEVGDPFPSYALADHEGELRAVEASTPRARSLYVFYRGDW